MSELKRRIAMITGASGNLGRAVARLFQEAGDSLILIERSADKLREAFSELADSPDHVLAGGVDLGDETAVRGLVDDVRLRFGRIDVLINTVGAWRGGKPTHEEELATWDFLWNANLRTTLHCCRAVVPAMLSQRRGRIINVASRDGLTGTAGYGAYSASKAAVLRLTEALADELKASDITANAVLPGIIDTPQNRAASPTADFSKWVEPAAIAEVILFLASDAARAVTGAAIPVFGRS